MKPLHKIKEKISDLIQKEMDLTNAEIADLQQKQQSNMSVYGIGGFYKRYENAIKRRYNHLEELEALQKVQGRVCECTATAVPAVMRKSILPHKALIP